MPQQVLWHDLAVEVFGLVQRRTLLRRSASRQICAALHESAFISRERPQTGATARAPL
jgi:hypothetical protein